MNASENKASLTILTMSFARDFQLCKLLCQTIDAFVPQTIEHVLAVPRSDLEMFSVLKAPRRRIVAEDEFTPAWLRRMPSAPGWIRDRVKFARRNVYFSFKGPPVRGWIVQQLMKLRATEQIGSETIMHVDSDVAFVRPFESDRIFRDGRAALLRFPGQANGPSHQPWHHAAAAALSLPDRPYFGADYISNCVIWRRSAAKAMLEHIGATMGKDPIVHLSRTANFSEYILYGIFCEFVLGLEAAGHFASDKQLCKTLWTLDGHNVADANEALTALDDEVAIGIQSTIPVSIEMRQAILKRVML